MKALFFLLALSIAAQEIPLLRKAQDLAAAHHFPQAESVVRDYLKSHPDSPDAHFLLGYILFSQSKAKESLAEYTAGAKYRSPSAHDLKVVASDYVVLSDFPDADKWFTKVVEWSPNDVQAWYDLGRTKYNENRFDEAITTFKHTLELDPAHEKALDNLGLSYAALGRNDEAADAYKRAIDLEEKTKSGNPGPYLDWGALLVDTGKVDESLAYLNQALAIAPNDFRIHRELGKAYLHLNKLDESAAELTRAIQLAPADAPLHFMLAQVYRKQGKPDKAKQETDRYTALK